MKYFYTRYLLSYPRVLLYMLQDTEYHLGRYMIWLGRTRDFRTVMKRRTLEVTQKVRLLLIVLRVTQIVLCAVVIVTSYIAIHEGVLLWGLVALCVIVVSPFILAYGIIVPLFLGYMLIQKPRERGIIAHGHKLFAEHKGTRIAVVGSFGKTTAKEIILSVLSHGTLKVAATPGNMNTLIGVSRFVQRLSGDEDVLIVEFGEEKKGDIKKLSRLVRPTMGIMTGINESHLASFKSLEQTISTIFELTDYLEDDAIIYKNIENELLKSRVRDEEQYGYSRHGVHGWTVSDLSTSLHGTSFTATKGHKTVRAKTHLVGLHTVGVTTAAIDIADGLGMTTEQIEKGLSHIKPFEHRMEPRRLHGAWIIDDTYNGNSDGIEAGLTLLKDVDAKRRIYVTPGLVEQGDKTEEVHYHIGQLIAKSADIAVLMRNSVTDAIIRGLDNENFQGELIIIDNPLEFYTNLEHFIAAGDVVLMQNDWTDNYA